MLDLLPDIFQQAMNMLNPKQAEAAPSPTPTPAIPSDNVIPQKIATIDNDPGAQYNSIFNKASQDYGVPAPLLKGVGAHESMQFAPQYVKGYHTDGTGRGIMAIDKNAHPEITDDQAFDPNFSIQWAAKTLKAYHDQEGSWFKALQRYNGGPNYNSNAPGFAGVPVVQRTMNYANNVFSQANHFAGVQK